ncbi:hypothetical protein QFZ77_004557 [Paenibacillus sp. V4I3]|nr:hypothetical protein [Paenibacillus sp. V4I3]MDQ0888039.1 hypothetical protein [Paenibacillus sp. V4I9]
MACQRIGISFIKTIWIPITLGYVMKYIFQDQKNQAVGGTPSL